MSCSFSIIIPALNEAEGIGELLDYLHENTLGQTTEIIVIDGGSTDNTLNIAKEHGALVHQCEKGRALQMNKGAAVARNEVLYFLHADTYPPQNFLHLIAGFLDQGKGAGCFRLKFDHPHWFLKANAWFTRFSSVYLRFGDQSLFIKKSLFEQISGYDEQHVLMEDQEIIYRIKKKMRFGVIPASVTTSARKYLAYGPFPHIKSSK